MYLADKQHNSYPAHLLQFAQHENFVEYFSSQTELPSFLCPTLVGQQHKHYTKSKA